MNDDAYVIPGAPVDGGAFSRQLNSDNVPERNDAILLGLETLFQAMADELRTAGADGNDSEIAPALIRPSALTLLSSICGGNSPRSA